MKSIYKKAFTAIELIVVLIIIGILVAITVPTFRNSIERTRGDRAISNIEMINDAFEIYKVKYPGTTNDSFSLDDINNFLGLELNDPYFAYTRANFRTDNIFIRTARIGSGETIRYAENFANGAITWSGTWDFLPE